MAPDNVARWVAGLSDAPWLGPAGWGALVYLCAFLLVAVAWLAIDHLRRRRAETGSSETAGALAELHLRGMARSELAPLLLGRLSRLAALETQHQRTNVAIQQLVHHALISTRSDCEALGLAREANAVLAANRFGGRRQT